MFERYQVARPIDTLEDLNERKVYRKKDINFFEKCQVARSFDTDVEFMECLVHISNQSSLKAY